jgi:hypothetical protein
MRNEKYFVPLHPNSTNNGKEKEMALPVGAGTYRVGQAGNVLGIEGKTGSDT